jgi:hypothetical protein
MKKSTALCRLGGQIPAAVVLVLMTVSVAHADYKSTVLGDNPIAYFALDLTIDNNNVATDLSGNGNNSSYYNMYPVAGPTPYLPNAASFAGASLQSYVDLSTAPNPGLLNFGGPITMEAWVQSTNVTQGPADIWGKGYDSTQNDDELVLRANGNNFYGGTYNNTNGGASASGGVQTTNWTYLVATYDGTNWNLYLNTKLVGTGADTVGAINFSDPWAIGTGSADGGSRFFEGNICQAALYARALTPAQILTHFYSAEVNQAPATSVPLIVTQPQSQPSYVGGSVTFGVGVVSALPVTNQWYVGTTALAGQTNSTLTLSDLQLTNAANYSVVVGNANGTTNSAVAVLTVTTPRNLQWSANGNSGTWDTATSANWINLANSQATVFNPGDTVLFDDTANVPTSVTVSGSVVPSVMTVNSSVNNYSFGNSGSLSGSGTLVKEGSSTLTDDIPRGFAGSVLVEGGTFYSGNNTLANVGSVLVTNNATLDFGGGGFSSLTPITVSGTGVNGQGALVNSYGDDPSELANITMAGDTLIAGTQRWDLPTGSQINGPHTLTVDWSQGASYGQWNGVTIGANVVGINLTNAGSLGMTSMDTSCQNPATLLTIGTNDQLVFYSGAFNGSISLLNGASATVYNGNLNLGGSNLHIYSGATLYLYAAGINLTGNTLTLEDGAAIQTYYNGGVNLINNAVTLNGVAHFVLGDHDEDFTNVISGIGGFVVTYYNHAIGLSSSNTYSGPTVIGSDGSSPYVALTGNGSISHSSVIFFGGSNPSVTHLDASGRSDGTLTLASGQTLAGVGGINGNLVVSTGATVSPSGTNVTSITTLTSTNAVGAIAASGSVTLAGTTVIKLDGSGSNDMVQAAGNITYGGTLNLVNISGAPLAAGNTFQVFSGANYLGTFGNLTPATPGAGLAWDTTHLNSGIVGVVSGSAAPVISSTKVSGGSLIFSGTGGTANATFYVLATTNLAGVWSPIATNTYDGSGNFTNTLSIPAGVPHQFYRTSSQP